MKRCASISVMAVGWLITQTVLALDRYEFKLRFYEGQSWRFEQSGAR
jgi:hypothetical protein